MTIISIYLAFLYILCLIFIILSITQILNKNTLSTIFSSFSLVSAIYVLGVAGVIQANTYGSMLFFLKLKYFGFPYIAPIFFLFLYRLSNHKLPKGHFIFMLFIIPVIVTILVSTNEIHWLYYKSLSVKEVNGFLIFVNEKGILYIFSFYNFFITVLVMYYIIKIIKKRNKRLKKLIISIFINIFSLLILNLLYLSKILVVNIELVPLAMVFQIYTFYVATFELKLFDISEIEMKIEPRLSEGVILIDNNDNIIHYNLAAKNIFSFLNQSIIGNNIYEVDGANILTNNLEQEFIIKVKNELSSKRYLVKVNDFSGNIKGKSYIINDYTDQYKFQQRLKWMAEHDGLTKIYNQVYTLEILEKNFNQASKNNNNYNIIMMDINNFKLINDKYGHITGNKVLVAIADTINSIYSSNSDTIFGRFGGDEFIIACSCNDVLEINNRARDLIDEINNINILDYEGLKINVSIGIASTNNACVKEGCNYIELVEKADKAMYESKAKGDNIITNYCE